MTKKAYRRIIVKNSGLNRRRANIAAVKYLKVVKNRYLGIDIEFTRMTAKSGKIIYGVVVRNRKTDRRYRTWTFETIGEAWNRYKACVAA